MVFRSPWPDQGTYEPLTVLQLIERTVERLPDKPAIGNAGGQMLTYRQYWDGVRGMARALQDDGIGKGDMVGIYAPNCAEYGLALHGAMMAGATVTTLNPLYREREVEHQLGDAGAKALFTLAPLKPVVDDARKALPKLSRIYELEKAHEMARAGEPKPVDIDPMKDLAVLPFSSGTTGLPKGVMLTHQNLTANTRQTIATGVVKESDVLLDILPFFHIYGMAVALNAGLTTGVTQVVMPRFDPEAAMGLIQEHKVTVLFFVPPAILALVNQPRLAEFDLSSVRMLVSGAAPLPAEVGRQAEQKLPGCIVMQAYGMTEASPVTNMNPLDSPREGTVGPPVPDTLEKVVSLEDEKELQPGEIGELLVYGPQVMQGYWNRPDATAETITPDGWLRTGDIASVDADGYVTIHDRKKEMIKYKGYQVAPAELESVLMEHPGVRDAAVIPKADDEAGEVPKAFVVPREDGLDLDAVLAFVAERVAPYKKIRHIETVEAIPKNPSGKILRRQLIEQERAREGQRV
jgi:acyl-CoA synthetase (AMP-forming)/AMP-acid ligase II